MPTNLGDYCGSLLMEVTKARVQADLEAVRIAQFYASDPILKNLTVPHFRLPTVTLDIPIIIKDIEKKEIPASEKKNISDRMREVAFRVVDYQIKQTGFELSPTDQENLKTELNSKMANIDPSSRFPLSFMGIGSDIVSTTSKVVKNSLSENDVDGLNHLTKLSEGLKTEIYTEFLKFIPEPPYINALVTSAELREASPNEIVRLHLSISEDSFENIEIKSNGKVQNRLIKE